MGPEFLPRYPHGEEVIGGTGTGVTLSSTVTSYSEGSGLVVVAAGLSLAVPGLLLVRPSGAGQEWPYSTSDDPRGIPKTQKIK